MKKFHVFIEFKNGEKLDFATDTNVRLFPPKVKINGIPFVALPEHYVYNPREVKKLTVKRNILRT